MLQPWSTRNDHVLVRKSSSLEDIRVECDIWYKKNKNPARTP